MRKHSWRVLAAAAIASFGLGLGLETASASGPIYRWESDDGVLAFTDDARRVPARYRAEAATIRRRPLKQHARFTPTDPEAALRYAERLADRLERLRALNARFDEREERVPGGPASRRFTLSTGNRTHTTLDLPVEEEAGPIVVESRRIADPDTGVTRLLTVVRQGDRILTIVKPRPRVYRPGFGSLSDLQAR